MIDPRIFTGGIQGKKGRSENVTMGRSSKFVSIMGLISIYIRNAISRHKRKGGGGVKRSFLNKKI